MDTKAVAASDIVSPVLLPILPTEFIPKLGSNSGELSGDFFELEELDDSEDFGKPDDDDESV